MSASTTSIEASFSAVQSPAAALSVSTNDNPSPVFSSTSNNSSPLSPNTCRIKCSLNGQDMHVFTLNSEEQHDFMKLVAKIKQAFNFKTDVSLLKYRVVYVDSDGDEVTIANSQDLIEACRVYPNTLKLNLLQKELRRPSRTDESGISTVLDNLAIRKESVSNNNAVDISRRASAMAYYRSSVNGSSSSVGPAPVAGPDHPLYKTVECKHWASTQTCPRGNQCGFWHRGVDPEDLLSRRVSRTLSPTTNSPRVSTSLVGGLTATTTGVVSTLPRVSENGFKPYKACQYFIAGKCLKGEACTFSHDPTLCAQQAAQAAVQAASAVQSAAVLAIPLEPTPGSRRHSTGAGLQLQSSIHSDGTSTPQRRAYHQQAASYGGGQMFLTPQSQRSVQRTHYKSEFGSDKVEQAKSWRRTEAEVTGESATQPKQENTNKNNNPTDPAPPAAAASAPQVEAKN